LLNYNKTIPNKTLIMIILLVGWCVYVMYPNPYHLAASIYRLKNPPVMPGMVSEYARELENKTPMEIEQFVYNKIPYSYDWEAYSMPWYFPALNEALARGTGDCKARYLLFASLMEELDIPYRKNVSLTHIWAEYEGKPQTALENTDESMLVIDEEGSLSFSLPRPDLSRVRRSFVQAFWEVMPVGRKYLLFTGFPLIVGFFYLPLLESNRLLPPVSFQLPAKKKELSRFAQPER